MEEIIRKDIPAIFSQANQSRILAANKIELNY